LLDRGEEHVGFDGAGVSAGISETQVEVVLSLAD
jgi:hypothetical protein